MKEIIEGMSYLMEDFYLYFKIFTYCLVLFLILKSILYIKKKIQLKHWAKNNFMNMSYVRSLSGHQFESYFEKQIRALGFIVEKTPASYDFGVDIILNNEYAIQLKNYTNTVGISAIQEIYAGSHYYGKVPVVIATNYYTKSAKELASKLKIELIDLDDIKNWGNRYYSRTYLHKSGAYELIESRLIGKKTKRKVS